MTCFFLYQTIKSNCEHFFASISKALPSAMACHVLTEMSPGGSLMSTTSETSMQRKYSILLASFFLNRTFRRKNYCCIFQASLLSSCFYRNDWDFSCTSCVSSYFRVSIHAKTYLLGTEARKTDFATQME